MSCYKILRFEFITNVSDKIPVFSEKRVILFYAYEEERISMKVYFNKQ